MPPRKNASAIVRSNPGPRRSILLSRLSRKAKSALLVRSTRNRKRKRQVRIDLDPIYIPNLPSNMLQTADDVAQINRNRFRPRNTKNNLSVATTTRAVIESRFAIGLLNPSAKIALRWPTPIPVPTALLTWRGTTTIVANALGFFFLTGDFTSAFSSGNSPTIWLNNGIGVGPTTDISGIAPTTVVAAPYFNNVFRQFRLVSAELQVYDTNSVNTRSGSFLIASAPVSQMLAVGTSADTLKDSYYSFQSGTAMADGARAVALPLSAVASGFSTFQNAGAVPPVTDPRVQWSVPMIALANGIAGGQYTVAWAANYEVVPSGSQLDLYPVAPGPQGVPDNAVINVGAAIPAPNDFRQAMANPPPAPVIAVGGRPVLPPAHPLEAPDLLALPWVPGGIYRRPPNGYPQQANIPFG